MPALLIFIFQLFFKSQYLLGLLSCLLACVMIKSLCNHFHFLETIFFLISFFKFNAVFNIQIFKEIASYPV